MDDESRTPPKIINAMKARKYFGQMLEEVYYKGDRFIIERAGKPMAAVVPLSQLEELQKIQNQPKPGPDAIKGNKRLSKRRRT
jgi:prevent-host-death family protein